MNWFLLVLISVVTAAISSILQRVLMKDKKSDPFVYGLVFQILCAFLIGLFALLNGFTMPKVTQLPINFILLVILYAGFSIALFKAYQTTEASEVTILSSSRIIWTIVVALLFLGETYNFQKAVGAILIVSAMLFVTHRRKRFSFHKGHIYALTAAFCFGLAVANDAYIIRTLKPDIASYTSVAFLLPGILILTIKPSVVPKMKDLFNSWVIKRMVLLGVFYSISAITGYLAYQYGANASQVAPISLSTTILVVILAATFLKERDRLITKLISAVFVIVGVLLLR